MARLGGCSSAVVFVKPPIVFGTQYHTPQPTPLARAVEGVCGTM